MNEQKLNSSVNTSQLTKWRFIGAGKLMKALVASFALSLGSAAWATCPGVNLQVGYDFDFGAKTGIAPADTGVCVAGATTAPAGDDYCSSATNSMATGDYVIRTGDTGTATLKYLFNVGTKHDNYTITVTIPQTGQTGATSTRAANLDIATWSAIPSACSGPGSALSNGDRTLTCNLGTVDATSGALTIAVPASFKVSNRALNTETFALQSTETSSGGSSGACAAVAPLSSQALTVSARPKYDVKTTIYATNNATYGGVPGRLLYYYIYVDAVDSTKRVGGEAAAVPFVFNVGLSSNVPTTGVKLVNIYRYGANTTTLTSTTANGTLISNGSTTTNIIPLTLTPDASAPNCAAEFLVPGGACTSYDPVGVPYRMSMSVVQYFVPLSDFDANTTNQIDFTNFINSNGGNVAAPINTPPASNPANPAGYTEPINLNSYPYSLLRTGSGTYAKYTTRFAYENGTVRPAGSPAGNTVPMPGQLTSTNWCEGGECKQYPGQSVQSMIHVYNRSETQWTNTIICDKFDNRGQVLTAYARKAGIAAANFPSNVTGDTIVGMYEGVGAGWATTMPDGYTVQVATSPGTPLGYPANSQQCGDADATWVNPSGITDFSTYNMVRIVVPKIQSTFVPGVNTYISPVFNFTVPTTAPVGDYIGNQMMIRTDTEKLGGALPGDWNTSTYNPLTNSGVYTGERFQVIKALVRVKKEAYSAVLGSSSSVIGAGKTATFKLLPTFTAEPGVQAPDATITVIDTLPADLSYVSGTARVCPGGTWCAAGTGTLLTPNSLTVNGSGQQVLTWVLPSVVLNSAVPPIYFDVVSPSTLPAGTVLTNNVRVDSPSVDLSTDAERSASRALVVDNVAGFFVTKKVSVPLIAKNGTYSNTLEVANLKNTLETNVDVIDVLPRNGGDNRTPPSNFSGTSFLTGPVTGISGTAGMVVYYTKAAVGAPPTALNSTTGGTVASLVGGDFTIAATAANGWCLPAEFGTGNCPSTLGSFADVTAFRVKMPTIGGLAVAKFNAPMGTSGNVDTNIYTNRFVMRSDNAEPLFSNDVFTTVKSSTLAGKVFIDNNLDSQPNTGEPPIAGVTITLCNVATPIPCPVANTVATTTTLADGTYKFVDLPQGTYYVRETQPALYQSAGANLAGSAGGTVPSPDAFDGIVLGVGQDAVNYNFGEKPVSVSGTVFNDVNGLLGTPVNTVDGVGTQAGSTTLTAYLVNSAGVIVGSAPVAANGTYTIPSVLPGTGYKVVLSNVAGTTGAEAGISTALPAGWVNTGENNAAPTVAGSDGTIDGKTATFDVTNANVLNRNFGIEQPPVAGTVTYVAQPNPGGTALLPVGAGAFAGVLPTIGTAIGNVITGSTNATDPAPGAVTTIKITAFPTNTTTITIKGVTYTPATFAVALAVAGSPALTMTVAELAGLAVDPVDGIVTVTIPYIATDAAGIQSGSGSVILPLTGVTVSGNVFNDLGGLVANNLVDGTGTEAPPSTTLTAYLIDSTGKVAAVSDVSATGTFSFANVPSGPGYTVVLSNVATTVVGAAAPAPSLPAGWVNTGEANGPTATTPNSEVGAAIADGITPSFTVAGTDVLDRNFGIEQLPTPIGGTAPVSPNPGGTTQSANTASLFTGTDPDGGIVTAIKITAFPTGATSISIGGITYTTLAAITAAYPNGIPTTATGTPTVAITVDPTAPGATTVTIPFVNIDNAGKQSTTTATVTVPFTALNVSGNVFNDVNGLLGSPANTVDGTPTNAGSATLTAYLIDSLGKVVSSSPVAADGTFSFANVPNGTGYTVVVSNTAGVAVGAAPPAPSLPAGWVNTGENNAASTVAGSDGAVNGISAAFDVAGADVINRNFGIEQLPTPIGGTAPVSPNPGGTTQSANTASLFTGTDPDGGIVTAIKITAFPTGATSISIGGITYTTLAAIAAAYPNGIPTTATGTPTVAITVDPTAPGATTVTIPFVNIDNAGKQSTTTATVTVPFASLNVSGNVYNDVNGLLGAPLNTVDGTPTNAGSATLTAYLVDSLGKVAGSSTVAADGTFFIANVPNGTGYTMVLSNTAGVAVGAAPPAPSLPAGWVNTGENNAASTVAGSDGTVNGISAAFDVAGVDVPNRNFGIEQPPTVGNAVYPNQTNPGGTATLPVGAGAFTGTLPPGVSGSNATDPTAVTQIKITAMPSNVTSITINGAVYTSIPAGGVTVTVAELANMAVDPVNGLNTIVIPYVAIDAAGKESVPGTVTIPLAGVIVSGNVYNDVNGLTDMLVNGVGTNAGSPALTAYLVNSANQILGSTTVGASGAFSFGGVVSGTGYTVILSNTAGIAVGAAPPAPSLPAGWVNTGENNAASTVAGSDGTVNGITAAFDVVGVNVIDRNLGIEQPPTPIGGTAALSPNPGGTTQSANTASLFTGTDPAGGIITAIKITAFPTGATSISIGGITYTTLAAITAAYPNGIPTNAAGTPTVAITVDPSAPGATTVTIPFVNIDNAGKQSLTSATVTVPFTGLNVSGNVFNDVNGLLGTPLNTVDGTPTNAGSGTLTAYLVDSLGAVVASSPVAVNGTFNFTNVPNGTGYTVVLSNTAGAAIGTAPPAPSLPTGWVNTGENNAASTVAGSDGTIDGKSAAFDIIGADVINRNFGIEQPPLAGTATFVSQPNPGSTVQVSVNPGAFTGALPTVGTAVGNILAGGTNATDPAPGAVTAIKITAFPAGATTITIKGVTYTPATFATALAVAGAPALTMTVAELTGLTVDPVDGATTVNIPYVSIDAAGKVSAVPGAVILPFLAPGKIDVVKAVGVPYQSGAKTFEIPYVVVVGNQGAAGTPTVFNVQADDNLKLTFPTATTITIKAGSFSALNNTGTPTPACANPTTAFAGSAAASKLLSGTTDMAPGDSCVIRFVAMVDFGANPVPTGIAQNNTVLASGVGSDVTVNPGYTVPDTGPAIPPTVNGLPVATTTDISVDSVVARPPTGSAPGTPPSVPAPITGAANNPAGVVTPVTLTPQKIDVVKAVGVPLQTGAKTFDVPYAIVVANVGATSPTVWNVQADDNLKLTFPTATSITVASYAVTAGAGTPVPTCTPAVPAYLGTAAGSKMLSGTNDLLGGQSCVITFVAKVDFGTNPIPTGIAQNNTVYASGVGADAVANPGYSVPDTGAAAPANGAGGVPVATTTDISVDSVDARPPAGSPPGTPPVVATLLTKVPVTPGADAPAGVPTPVTLTPQKIDIVKAVGVPKQTAAKVFEVPYTVVVGNVGVSSPTVYNVQADDNLKPTFPTAASITIKAASYTVSAVGTTPAAQCTPSTAPVYAGTASASHLLSGTGDLAGGQACVVNFIAVVDFGANPIPVGIAQNNSVFASGVGVDTVPNPGTAVSDTGVPTYPAVATTTDVSVDSVAARPAAGSPPGTPPVVATLVGSLPATPGADPVAGVPTPVSFIPQKIDVVKAAGVPKQVGPKVFAVDYSVVVGNVGATSPTLYNVQADDNLKQTFPTAEGYVVSNYAVAPAAGTPAAACTAAVPAYLGTAAASKMLKGDGDLAGGQSCVITFKVTVDFGANPVPTVAQNNTVFASAVGANEVPNPGYSVPDTGVAVAPSVATTTDISVTAPPTSGAPGTLPTTPTLPNVSGGDIEGGVPTPVILVIEEDGDILIKKSTVTKVGSAGDVVEYVINVSNTSSSALNNVKVTDTPPVGFEYVAGSAKVGGAGVTASPSGDLLIFQVGTIAAKSSIELRYQMKLGDTVEAGDATNCVAAAGTNSLTSNVKESGKTCATILIETGLFLEKRVNLSKAEIGDSVEYSLRVKSVGGTTKNVKITDNMPLGFKLILGTVKIIRGGVTTSMVDPAGAPGPQTVYSVGTVANKEVVEIRYRVRLGVGSDLGDGINKAQAKAPFARSSLIATAKVEVTRGVFTREACVIGKVFVDCNQNKVQDACIDDGTGKCTKGEPGIPGVRLYMEDGTNITTDENGQYSICGVRAISHVMQVDMTTMPIGSRMGITSNRNLGDGVSLLMNPKAGELYRADFIESSCYPKILEQVEQRQQNGAGSVAVPLKQVGQDKPGIVFDSKEQELLHPSLRSSTGSVVGGVK